MVVRHAVALVAVVDDEAERVVLTRVRVALLELDGARGACEAEGAGAEERALGVHAHAAVLARAEGGALVHVGGAAGPGPA